MQELRPEQGSNSRTSRRIDLRSCPASLGPWLKLIVDCEKSSEPPLEIEIKQASVSVSPPRKTVVRTASSQPSASRAAVTAGERCSRQKYQNRLEPGCVPVPGWQNGGCFYLRVSQIGVKIISDADEWQNPPA
jgi:hypothetical protein